MEWGKSVIIMTAIISIIIILLIVIVIPAQPPVVNEDDMGPITSGMPVIEEEIPALYWEAFSFKAGESYSFRSTFPDQIGEYSFDVQSVSGDEVTIHFHGALNDSFDKVITSTKDNLLSDMVADDELNFLGSIVFFHLSDEYRRAFSKLDLSVGTNYVSNDFLTVNLTVTGSRTIKEINCYLVDVCRMKYKYFEVCISPDLAMPVRVRHYQSVTNELDYVISLMNYTIS